MKLTEAACTSIRISSPAGTGSSNSPMRRSSAPVKLSQSTALIGALQSYHDQKTAWGAAKDLAKKHKNKKKKKQTKQKTKKKHTPQSRYRASIVCAATARSE